MITVRIGALGLILIQLGALAHLSQTRAFPIVMGMLAVAIMGTSTLTRFSYPMNRRRRIGLYLAVGVAAILKWRLLPMAQGEYYGVPPFGDYALAHALAQAVMVIQVLEWFIFTSPSPQQPTATSGKSPFEGGFRGMFFSGPSDSSAAGEKGTLPPSYLYLPALSTAGMILAADRIAMGGWNHRVFLAFCAAYAVCFAAYYMACRQFATPSAEEHGSRPLRVLRYLIAAAIALAAAGTGSAVSAYLNENIAQLDRIVAVLSRTYNPSGPGFSRRGLLGNVTARRQRKAKKIILRVASKEQPGYLRGLAFDHYDGRQWHRPGRTSTLPPARISSTGIHFFRLRDDDESDGTEMMVWPHSSVRDVGFMPKDTWLYVAPLLEIRWDMHHAVETPKLPPNTPYTVAQYRTPKAEAIDPEVRERCLKLPKDLDPRIEELAKRILDGGKDPLDKIGAVTRYFHENYDYTFGITIPPGENPLTHFLIEQPAAHCEYFASGAAVLLRLGGVPCRYVSGFMASEKDKLSELWLARNRDAHAWVEAWTEETGWVTVEATPASGLPGQVTGGGLGDIVDYLRFQARQFFQRARHVHPQRALIFTLQRMGRIFLHTAVGRLAVAGIVLFVVYRVLRRWRRKPRRPKTPAELASLHGLLAKADGQARRRGLERGQSETLHRFSRRVEETDATAWGKAAAVWYRKYAAARYATRGESNLAQLRHDLEQLAEKVAGPE